MAGVFPEPNQNISPLIRNPQPITRAKKLDKRRQREVLHEYLARREIGIQIREKEIKEKHRIKMEQKKKEKEAEEMNALGKEAGVTPK